jgi:hypothetical protein
MQQACNRSNLHGNTLAAHMPQSCSTYASSMQHICLNHAAHMLQACSTYASRHAAHMPQSCSTYASSMQHICLKTCSNFHFIFEGSCRMFGQSFVLCVMYLYFLFWPPLCCLYFDIRIWLSLCYFQTFFNAYKKPIFSATATLFMYP